MQPPLFTAASTKPPATYRLVHSWPVRACHWIGTLAVVVLAMSGWRIYNASPLFAFTFSAQWTLGGSLTGALQWHFAMMWLFTITTCAYAVYGVANGHFRRRLLPIGATQLRADLHALPGVLWRRRPGAYTALQRLAYSSAIVVLVLILVSGLALWKPVQLQELAWLMGGYEGARHVHFFTMLGLTAFVVVHGLTTAVQPQTLVAMITGKARIAPPPPHPGYADGHSTEAGDAL